MYRGRSTTLFVRDFDRDLRAKDLGKEFCRFGPLVRCDIPAPKPGATHSYAFVEFEHHRDAEDALYAMDDRRFYEKRITVEPEALQQQQTPLSLSPQKKWQLPSSEAPSHAFAPATWSRPVAGAPSCRSSSSFTDAFAPRFPALRCTTFR
ncbi:hypothetical protein PhCBS80983_g03702 [Powellomyces hirtus]|uniref:RRM domain-containing protein n=1 Tax=Powellomyces hirtus TaxID=109895 RepID=A0A507E0M5_9FUNG|nr:hypothetical protein DFJ77DRAFT_513563 [Powellomyces hirtus]TPX57659.1 hypothetical protein PhCBS80983_g03702 [Powellomyces hirtus]